MEAIGQYVKRLRDEKDLNQEDLVEKGVLSQSQLSKIERGIQDPNIDQLKYFSEVFHVPLETLVDIIEKKRQPIEENQQQFIDQTILQIRQFVRYQNYLDLECTLQSIEKHPLFSSPAESQLLTWHQGILANELYRDIEKALHYFDKAILHHVPPRLKERKIEIYISIGAAYINQNKPELALAPLKLALKILRSLYHLHDRNIHIRLLYNLSIVSYQLENFKESTLYIKQAHKICKEIFSSYLIGEIHFQYGLNQYYLKNLDKARESMNIASFYFKQEGQEKHLLYVCETIEKYKLK